MERSGSRMIKRVKELYSTAERTGSIVQDHRPGTH